MDPATGRPEVIILNGNPTQSEGKALAALSPGHVVELSGNDTGVRVVSTAGKNTALRVVTADLFQGKTIQEAYATGSNVYFSTLRPGDKAQLRLPASAGAIVRGDQLQLSADGTLIKLASGTPVAEALEAVDNSAGAEEAFINIEAI